jgi:hypothetical protein
VKLLLVLAAIVLCACPANNTAQPVPPSPVPASGYEPPDDHTPPPPPVSEPDAGPVADTPPPPPPPPQEPKADGAQCYVATECASGVCEGLGCGGDTPGTCAPAKRGCTKDRRAYCGCDGITFYGSGSCPGKRYAAKAACPNG